MIFIFAIIADLQCSVNFLLYSNLTQLHIHVYILFSHIIMLYHKWLDRVPNATQQDLIAYPFQRQQFSSINPKFPIHPTPSPSPKKPNWNWFLCLLCITELPLPTSILHVHGFLSCGKVHLCLILDPRYKWYHMVFGFLFMTYFTLYESLVLSMLLQMALFRSFLWLSSIPLCIYTPSSQSNHLSMEI